MMKKQLKRLLCCLTLCAVLTGGLTVPAAAAGADRPVSASETASAVTSIHSIGSNMLSTGDNGYLLPFEAVSVLLLACIVGALLIARKR